MAEYIEREAALMKLMQDGCSAKNLQSISDMPGADVAPVVHGEWLLKHIGAGPYWECSVCHTNPCIYVTEHTKFCPNCGARMDGGNEKAID